MKINLSVLESLKRDILDQSSLLPGASIPLFNGCISPFKFLDEESVSFLRERAMTILNQNNSNFVLLKNTRETVETKQVRDLLKLENPSVDFMSFPILELMGQIKVLLETAFDASIIAEYILLSKLARVDRHQDYSQNYFRDDLNLNKYRVPIGISIFLGPHGGSPFRIYSNEKTITQDFPGTMAIFGPTVEHGHPTGGDSYYIVYQPTLEYTLDCGCDNL